MRYENRKIACGVWMIWEGCVIIKTMIDVQPKKHSCPDCRFCQCCSESRCNMCRPSCKGKKDKKDKKEKVHRPLFQKF
ncbi:MAG TPA: hypothetical protein VMB78_01940 [Dissulfurispiraceae bacterium]|nr:hypothetical protein [Dissulfurispiraceae bacterium]